MAPEVRDGDPGAAARASALGAAQARAILARARAGRGVASAEHDGELLRREGLSTPRRRLRYMVPLTQPLAAAQAPNDVWTADFKGWFRTGGWDALRSADGGRCVQSVRAVLSHRGPTGDGVRPWFERTFRTYGLPRALRTDNGSPFASTGPGRLSRLAVWWLKLGIQLDRIDPGHPGTERPPRALSPDAADRGDARRPRRSKPAATTAVRSATAGLQ